MDEVVSAHELLKELKFGIERDSMEITDKAMRVLYARFAKCFYHYAVRQGLTHEDADDTVEDVFERILNSIESYDETKAGGEKWMWTICKHIVIDKQRKSKHVVSLPDDNILSRDTDPALMFEKKEHSQALKHAWEHISESDRQELQRGKGRGPGRTRWHEAAKRFREALFEK